MRTLTLLLAALLGVLSRGVAADGADEAFSQDQLKRERDLIGLRGPVGPRGNHGPLGRKGARGDVGPGGKYPPPLPLGGLARPSWGQSRRSAAARVVLPLAARGHGRRERGHRRRRPMPPLK